MARLLVDTSVLVDHLRGEPRAVAVLVDAARRGDELWSVTLVRTELIAGMRRGEEQATARLLDQLRFVDVTVEIADRAGELARRFLRTHPGVDTVDFVVAAATLALGADLVTQNVRHFPMFPTLRPAYG
jgi:predicted nucleic acid-binding protein